MAVMLPTDVSHLLNELGFTWPEGNEDTISAWSDRWSGFADEVDTASRLAEKASTHATDHNSGPAMQAFRTDFDDPDGVDAVSHDLGTGASVVAGCLTLIAGAVVALKLAFVANLVALAVTIAEAIATAVPTFGASLLEIPIAREITKTLIDAAVDFAVQTLIAG